MSGREVTSRVRGGAAGAADTGIALSKVSFIRVQGVYNIVISEYGVYHLIRVQGLSTKSDQNFIELEVNLNQTKSEPEPVN